MKLDSKIILKKKDFLQLEDYFWNMGGEGMIYRVPYNNQNLIIKLFFDLDICRLICSEKILRNKQIKIEILKKIHLPNYVQVFSTIYFRHQFIGYITNEATNYQPYLLNHFSTSERIQFLNRLKRQLNRFHQLGFIFGDLKSDNVLSHETSPKGCLCDLDNMKIHKYPIDIEAYYVEHFLDQYGRVDEKLDWYALNLLTLESIYNLSQDGYFPYQETIDFVNSYRGSIKTIREMQRVNRFYEGHLLLDDPNFYEELGIPYIKKGIQK